MPVPGPQDEPRPCTDEEDMMISYSSPDLVDAEMRYRRERLASDWRPRPAGDPVTGAFLARARAAVVAVGHLGTAPRRHRHA
jgi:hypothetical protein